MPGLVPGIHVFRIAASKTWIAGTSVRTGDMGNTVRRHG
jgi:hypothetical protein